MYTSYTYLMYTYLFKSRVVGSFLTGSGSVRENVFEKALINTADICPVTCFNKKKIYKLCYWNTKRIKTSRRPSTQKKRWRSELDRNAVVAPVATSRSDVMTLSDLFVFVCSNYRLPVAIVLPQHFHRLVMRYCNIVVYTHVFGKSNVSITMSFVVLTRAKDDPKERLLSTPPLTTANDALAFGYLGPSLLGHAFTMSVKPKSANCLFSPIDQKRKFILPFCCTLIVG